MQRTQAQLLAAIVLATSLAASTSAESRPRDVTSAHNPITVESQIKGIARDGDAIVITLQRQKYTFLAYPVTRVRWKDGRKMDISELLPDDYIRLSGNLDHETVYADRIVLIGRIEHRP